MIRIGGPFNPEEIFSFDLTGKEIYLNYKVDMSSQRYKIFKRDDCICKSCGIKGTVLFLEKSNPLEDKDKAHFNLYAIDKDGKEILMTKDHVIPRSKGGSNKLENLQTYCEICNRKKGNGENK